MYEFVKKSFHLFFILIYFLLIITGYLIGIFIALGCAFTSLEKILLLRELDDFTINNKDISIMSNEEITNLMINSISPEELLALPFFNSSFVEEAVSNRNAGIFFNNIEELKEFLHINDQSAITLENLVDFDIKKEISFEKNSNI